MSRCWEDGGRLNVTGCVPGCSPPPWACSPARATRQPPSTRSPSRPRSPGKRCSTTTPTNGDFLRAWDQHRRVQRLSLADQAGPGEPARARLHRYYAALAQMTEGERELTRMLHLSLQHDEVLAHQRPVPEAVLAAIHRGQDHGEFNPSANPSLAAEVLTAVYFDTLSRWLTEAEPPFDLSGVLADKLELVLAGLAVPPPRKRT